MIEITLIPVLKDNYSYLLIDGQKNAVIIDPGESGPVMKAIKEKNLRPVLIFNTHHHGDHIAGNEDIKKRYGCEILGPAADAHCIPGMDRGLREGDSIKFGEEAIEIIETPGHTSGHICLYLPQSRALFCGDTLFSLGCGRLFEGTPAQMWNSLQKIMALPDETAIYCGHEYTEANGRFCQRIEPGNKALQDRIDKVAALRARELPTLPSTLALEKAANVFLRAGNAAKFAEIRALKDNF